MTAFDLGNSVNSILGLKNNENNYDYNHSDYIFDSKKVNDAHTSVANNIKKGSSVLDIGCASGILGYVLSTYKNCSVDGIEYDKKASEIAKKSGYYQSVYNCSILDFDSSVLTKKYDYIVFADVLEHLDEPHKAILNILDLLSEHGKIIVSIPNICHIDIIRGLFNGDFNYSKYGILDSTHLRFFSANSFCQFINNINDDYDKKMVVKLIDQVKIKPQYFDDLELFKLGLSDKTCDQFLVLQNIFTIENSKTKKVNKLKPLIEDDFDRFILTIISNNEENNRIIENMKLEIDRLKKENEEYSKHLKSNNLLEKITNPIKKTIDSINKKGE